MITSLILFFVIEVVSYFITMFLTKWIVKPVEESFEREKRFIGDASHELKTPIAVIMASADAYSQDKNKKWLDNIKSESDRMNKLVTELLDLNSLENNHKEFKREEVDLSKLVESSLLPYESLFFEHNLKFTYDIKKNIKAIVNEDKIKELISILIDNAIKYSDPKGHVKVTLDIDNKDIYLKVSNQGEEIKEEDLNKIFDRFYKVDKSRNRKSSNYGLGLSIAKKIVDLHDGEISVTSKNGKTTFTVKL
jgi:signal transduction histidine kinase